MSSGSWYLIARLASEKGVLVEGNENTRSKWTLAKMEEYMRDPNNASLALGLVGGPNQSETRRGGGIGSNDKKPEPLPNSRGGSPFESVESSPSWASSSTGNTPSYASGGVTFEFGPKTENPEKMKNSATAPVITTTTCTPTSTPINKANKKKNSATLTLSSDLLAALESKPETRKVRKGSSSSMKDEKLDDRTGSGSHGGTPNKSGSKLSRLLRRTHSAGCSKDVPAHTSFSGKAPVTKTKSADSAPVSLEDGDEKQKRSRKTLAQDMKMRLSFLRRRHTDSSLQPSVRPSPEEAQRWAESFQELTNSKYGLSLFRAFLSREFSEENIEFWLACEDYKRARANKLPAKARKIYDDFVAVQSPKEVNIDSVTRSKILDHLQNPDRHSFDSAQRRIQGMMEQDAYLRFLQSELYTELIDSKPR